MKKRNSSKTLHVILLVLCLLKGSISYAQDSVKLGVLICLFGDCAEYGANSQKGIQLAVDEINSKGGILGKKIETVIEDSQDSVPSKTLLAYKKLTQRGDINFFVGPQWGMSSKPIAPLIKENKKIIFISPSVGIKDFAESADNIFNTWSPDENATRKLAQYAFAKGWKKIGIIGVDEVWTNTQADTFTEELTKLGGQITKRVNPLPGTTDLKPDVLRIKESNPDAVFIASYFYDIVAKEMQNMGIGSLPKFAILMEKDRVKSANGALEGTIFALGEKPIDNFTTAFKEKFNVDPGISADTAYDAVMLYKKAIEEVGNINDMPAIVKALHQTKNFAGASGVFSFDDKGIVDKKPVLWRVKGLEYERVFTQ